MKKILLSLLVVSMSAVSLSACSKKDVLQGSSTQKQEQQQQQNSAGKFSGSVKDLLGLNQAQSCEWQGENGEMTQVYVDKDGKRTRLEVKMPASEEQPATEMMTIVDTKVVHTWDNITKKGMKMKAEEMSEEEMRVDDLGGEDVSEMDQEQAEYEQEMTQEYQFTCQPWQVDESFFTPPTDVTFTDMSAMMEQMQQSAGEMKEQMKGLCNMLSGEEKAECLSGMEE